MYGLVLSRMGVAFEILADLKGGGGAFAGRTGYLHGRAMADITRDEHTEILPLPTCSYTFRAVSIPQKASVPIWESSAHAATP